MIMHTTAARAAHEPTLHCPNCNHEIKLTESLGGPPSSKKHASASTNNWLPTELRKSLGANDLKLAEAQKAQAELMRKERVLADEKRELDLTVEKRVQASIDAIRAKAKQESDDTARLKVFEKDQTIESMSRTIEELRRKAEQGSQQSQGEVFELELEELLRIKFPMDAIEPVAKGELGTDVVQQVNGLVGQPAGMILWEFKRTKAWSESWLAKLCEDQRRCGADVALIISHALPKNIEHFDLERDGSRLNRLRIPKSGRFWFNMLAGKEASMDGTTLLE